MNRAIRFGKETFSSLKIRNYRLYFLGQAISLCGTNAQMIAQAWLVLKLTNSGTAIGFIIALQSLPILLIGSWGGLVADRFPKRNILYVTQTGSAILALLLGILTATNSIQLWMVYVLALALGIINTFDTPTRQTFVLEMVGRENISNAVTLNATALNLARIIGPVVAGGLIATVGLPICFTINALSYIAVLIVLFCMHGNELYTTPPIPQKKGQLIDGFTYVLQTPILRNVLMMMVIIGTLSYEFAVILPLFAHYTFNGDATSYAILTGAMGVGAVIGGLFSATRKKATPEMLILMIILFGFTLLLSSIAPTFFFAVIALILTGFFSINLSSIGNVIIQLGSAPQMRGRVMALWTIAFMGSTPIGGPIIGWIGEHIGARYGLAIGGVAAIAAAILGIITIFKKQIVVSPEEEINI